MSGYIQEVTSRMMVYIPDFLRLFPRYRNLDNDPIIQYPGAGSFVPDFLEIGKVCHRSSSFRFDGWQQIQKKEPFFTSLAYSKDQESSITRATKISVCRVLSESNWLISRPCVHAKSGWLASPGNRKIAALSAVSSSTVRGQYHRCSWVLQWCIRDIKWLYLLIVFVKNHVWFLERSIVFQAL